MRKSFPSDVVVLDTDTLLHARVVPGRKSPQLLHARKYRVGGDVFTRGPISPLVANEAALTDLVKRIRTENGRFDRVTLLLPDSWFRMNILTLPSLPASRAESDEVVRWALKKTLPPEAGELRLSYVAEKNGNGYKALVVSALERTLKHLEASFSAAGVQIAVIEAIGLNIWNAIAERQPPSAGGSVFVYLRDDDFTTAVFRGTAPLFLRSRSLSGERRIEQEMKLSASYLHPVLQNVRIESCYVAGRSLDPAALDAIGNEFSAPVRRLRLEDFADVATGIDTAGMEPELIACTGVFAE